MEMHDHFERLVLNHLILIFLPLLFLSFHNIISCWQLTYINKHNFHPKKSNTILYPCNISLEFDNSLSVFCVFLDDGADLKLKGMTKCR